MHAYSVTSLSGQVLVEGCKLGGEIQHCPEDWILLALNALSGAQRPRMMVKHGRGQEDFGFPRLTVFHATTDVTRKASRHVQPSPSASEESRKPRASDNSS